MSNIYFKRKDKTKYISKEELYSQIDVYNPNTFIHHLQNLDIPWVPCIWEKYIKITLKRKQKLASTFGKYYNYMNLWSLKNYRFKDSEQLTYVFNQSLGPSSIASLNQNSVW